MTALIAGICKILLNLLTQACAYDIIKKHKSVRILLLPNFAYELLRLEWWLVLVYNAE